MSKYTEALRKIEEERIKQVQAPEIAARSFNLRKYILGISVIALIVMITVYAYGVYSGLKLKQQSSVSTVEQPISSAHQVSNADQSALLLENVEKMMQVPVPTENVVPKILPAKLKDFYTVQLIAYQQEAQAKTAAQKLVNQGYQAIIILRGASLFKVCTGKFETEEQANTELHKIRGQADSVYKDAFIRFVKAKNQNEANSNGT